MGQFMAATKINGIKDLVLTGEIGRAHGKRVQK